MTKNEINYKSSLIIKNLYCWLITIMKLPYVEQFNPVQREKDKEEASAKQSVGAGAGGQGGAAEQREPEARPHSFGNSNGL